MLACVDIMGIKKYKPYTPSRRFIVWYTFDEITKTKPEKSLVKWLPAKSGRNNQGRITSRFRGGRHKRLYRQIDWKGYDKLWVPWKVVSVEYDPFRTARIVLVNYRDWEKRYLLAWKWVKVWDETMNGENSPIASWNRKQLKDIPDGLTVYNIEFTPQTKGKIVKSAGAFAVLMGKDEVNSTILLKLPSGEIRKFNKNCWATIGQIWNDEHKNIVIGKAGRQRRVGKKSHVLWKSMNAVDHPHWGWEGHSPLGLKYPKAFNGRVVAPGVRTRRKKKWSDKMIVTRRNKK